MPTNEELSQQQKNQWDVRVESQPMTRRYDSPEQYWQLQLAISAPLRAAILTQPGETIEQIRLDVFASLADFTRSGTIALPATGRARV